MAKYTKIDLDYKNIDYSALEMPSKREFVTEKEMEDIQIKTFSVN